MSEYNDRMKKNWEERAHKAIDSIEEMKDDIKMLQMEIKTLTTKIEDIVMIELNDLIQIHKEELRKFRSLEKPRGA